MKIRLAKSSVDRAAGRAIFCAAILLCPALVLAQAPNRPAVSVIAVSGAKPECVYKAVMSDPEIEACAGHKVQYDYTVHESRLTQPIRTAIIVIPRLYVAPR